jgi:hypothetical protein
VLVKYQVTVPGDTGWIDSTRHDNQAPVAFANGHAVFLEREEHFNVSATGPDLWEKFLAWY